MAILAAGARAQAPALLATALGRWAGGEGEIAFTQETRHFLANGELRDERMERYDPSRPDNQRWSLTEVDGHAPSQAEQVKWESRKNSRPRRKVGHAPSDYLDLDHAAQVGETAKVVRYRVPLRPEATRLLEVEAIDVVLTVDKQSGNIVGVGAALKEPMRALLGLARVTNLDVDVRLGPGDDESPNAPAEVEPGSTARVTISRLGRPVEYNWSEFKRVPPSPAP
jgi:hypothetical protein